MTYPSYKKFLEAKTAEYMSHHGMDGTLTWFQDTLLEAVEAGIAAGKVEEKEVVNKESWAAKNIGKVIDNKLIKEMLIISKANSWNAAIVEAEKQSKSWLEK